MVSIENGRKFMQVASLAFNVGLVCCQIESRVKFSTISIYKKKFNIFFNIKNKADYVRNCNLIIRKKKKKRK